MSETITEKPLDPRTERSRREKLAKYGVTDLRTLRRIGAERMTEDQKRQRKRAMDRMRLEAAIATLKGSAAILGSEGWPVDADECRLAAADLEVVAGLHDVPVPDDLQAEYDRRQEAYSKRAMPGVGVGGSAGA